MEGFKGHCYCGGVEFEVSKSCNVHASLYCHCESCRRSHAAPVYHIVYVKPDDFSITKGENLVNKFSRTPDSHVRSFCSVCGSKIANYLSNKPWIGFFPATLEEEIQHDLPISFQPTMHYCGHEAVIDVNKLDSTLPIRGDNPLPDDDAKPREPRT